MCRCVRMQRTREKALLPTPASERFPSTGAVPPSSALALPGESTHPAGDGLRPPRRTPSLLRCRLQARVVTCASDHPAMNQRPLQFPPRVHYSARALAQLQTPVELRDRGFIRKALTQERPDSRGAQSRVMERCGGLTSCPGVLLSPDLHVLTSPDTQNPGLLSFYGGLII